MIGNTNRIMRLQPMQVFKNTKRNFMNQVFKKPEFETFPRTTKEKPSVRPTSATIKNGLRGETTFPKGTFLRTLRKELPKTMGAFMTFGALMVFWPVAAVVGSNFAHSAPTVGSTAQAQYDRATGKVNVEIPQAYTHLTVSLEDE